MVQGIAPVLYHRPMKQARDLLFCKLPVSDAGAGVEALLDRLVGMGGVAEVACVSAHRVHGIHSVDMSEPMFGLLLKGRKRLRSGTLTLDFEPGSIVVACAGARLDFRHWPDAAGQYLTLVVPLCAEVLEAARLMWGEPVRADGSPLAGRFQVADHVLMLRAWAEALLNGDYPAARAALVSLVVDWCRRGMTRLLVPLPQTLGRQIRALVTEQPARAWQSRDFEALLGMSGATLRRRLASEDTSLREVLADARLARAMYLFYTTTLPIKTVAARVGYRSPDAFVRAFRARYRLDPGDIGNDPGASLRV